MVTTSSPPLGVVLAGGASRRLGRDKATLALAGPAGETLVLRAARALAEAVGDVVVADRGRDLSGGRWPSLADGPGVGPAAGILGAAAARPGRDLLVLACDLPEAGPGLLRLLVLEAAASPAAAWVVPRVAGRLEQLCAVYRPAALAALLAAVRQGRPAPRDLASVPGLVVAEVGEDRLTAVGDPRRLLFNLNTPEDLERAKRALGEPARLAPPGGGG